MAASSLCLLKSNPENVHLPIRGVRDYIYIYCPLNGTVAVCGRDCYAPLYSNGTRVLRGKKQK